MTFIEKFEDNARLYPDKVILQDCESHLTFREVDELSGRVYAYLKGEGIGKEDFVMILLPHEVNALACMIGIWKAGAALVFCDDETPQERIDYVYKECGCKTIVDQQQLQKIKNIPPLKGHTETDEHDAAYAVFTSGSEGKPKGVIQEYGKIAFTPQSLLDTSRIHVPIDTKLFVYAPFSTVASINTATLAVINPLTLDIGSLCLIKNPSKLHAYFLERKITMASLTPSYYQSVRIRTPYLKCIHFSSEPTRNIYDEGVTLVNLYMQSEGYCITACQIDKRYGIAPIGKPAEAHMVQLLDEEGMPVKVGEAGELCYINPYFRGYINDEELTRQSFVGEYFRSGDIARVNEDGNYVILGRKTDMIKINGNRIEPAEIEAAVKRVLGIDWAFAKGFVQADRSFICVYYTAEMEIDLADTREQLLKILPNYMIPSYFIHIDYVPRMPNGKINRQAFKAPDVEQYRAAYAAPDNEVEERLCTLIQQILGIDRIGIDDDFFQLGGDSLRTIRLATECNIQGINVTDIYAARTPRAIAERWMMAQME